MSRPMYAVRALSAVVLLAVGLGEAASFPGDAKTQRRAPSGGRMRGPIWLTDTWATTLGFLDWVATDVSDSEIRANAANYVLLWGGLSASARTFRDANPGINVGRYTLAFQDEYNARPESFPFGKDGYDTPESRARTLLWWNTEVDGVGHPDWVMYQCDGVTPAFYVGIDRVPNMPLDLTNPAVADWQVRTVGTAALENGFTNVSTDMVALQNINGQCGVYRNGQWVQLFSGEYEDPIFADAVITWAGRLREGLHALPTPLGLMANVPLYSFYADENVQALAANLDGWIDEQGFAGYGTGRIYCSDENWLHKVRNMTAIQDIGVGVYSMNYVHSFPPTEDIDWILGSYLMARGHSAYLMSTIHDQIIPWPHLPYYDLDFGYPCGPMIQSQNVYVRRFSKGLAIVNPSSRYGYTYSLPFGGFIDLAGLPLVGTDIGLAPMDAKVLLSPIESCL